MEKKEFSGNIFIFQAFDVGDDIDLERIEKEQALHTQPLQLPKYFKNYHQPLPIELPHPHETSAYFSSKLENFGTISLTYKIPFTETLEALRSEVDHIYDKYQEQSVTDAHTIFNKIEKFIKKAKFFHLRTSYVVIQLDVIKEMDAQKFKESFGNTLTSLVRFETELLSEQQRKEIINDAINYYRGELVIVGSEVSFVYDDEYENLLDLFEFSNIQHLELMYFDQVLAARLNQLYERKTKLISKRQILPFMSLPHSPVADLGRLKVDISVITEQLQNSIMLANEPYLTEIYEKLTEKLALEGWKSSINNKLEIIKGISAVYYNRLETVRSEILEVLIIILIFIELILGIFK